MKGSIIVQIIALLITPFLTRLYTPEQFGSYALAISLVTILSVIVTARYEMAIMLPKSEATAQSILFLSFFIALAISLLISVLILIFDDYVDSYLGLKISFLIPVLVLLSGLHQAFKVFFNRRKAYKKMAINNVEQASTAGFTQLIFGWLNYSTYGLLIGMFVGQIVAVIRFFIHAKRLGALDLSKVVFLRGIASSKRYSYLLKFGVPAILTSRAAQESMIFLASYFMSIGIVGFILILNRIISIPSSIIGSNLGEVFYQKITETKKNKSFPVVKSFCLKLLIFSIPIYCAYYLFIKYSFILFFGEEWAGALQYMPYLLIVATFSFIFSSISILFNYYEVQGWNMIWQLIWLLSNILVFLIYKYFNFSINDFFLIYSIKQSLLYMIGIFLFIIYAKKIYEA
jgi:O-antigen/teichoic acid export membrane protein